MKLNAVPLALLACALSTLSLIPVCAQTTATTVIKSSPVGPARHSQRFSLTYDAIFDLQELKRGVVTVWIPFPAEDDAQTVESYWLGGTLAPEKLAQIQIKREAEYGNRYLEAQVLDPAPGDKISLQLTVVRREYSNPPLGVVSGSSFTLSPSKRFLQPDKWVPLDDAIKDLTTETLTGIDPKTLSGRDQAITAIYRKTIAMMTVDKTAAGAGRGDVNWALANKRGDCTDFHSVLIGMARAAGIPAKFEIGVSIPNDKAGGKLDGYHCWAYAFHPQRGWVPLDAFEGSKNDGKFADYYLGRIGSDRVAFSAGRDVKLGQRGEPLNFFITPYAEVTSPNIAEKVVAVPMKMEMSFKKLPFP